MYGNYQYPNFQIDRLNQLQQYSQQLQAPQQFQSPQQFQWQQMYQPQLNGKIVDSLESVKATDIPMDGQLYFFPKADATEIYAKRWLANGQTQIITYKVQEDNEPQKIASQGNEELTAMFNARFDELAMLIEKIKPSKKKEVTENE